MLNIETQKVKKYVIVKDESMPQEFIFKDSDKYAWDETKNSLYIFTANYQFY